MNQLLFFCIILTAFDLFLIILITLFFFYIFKFYFSEKNLQKISINRSNSSEVLSRQTQNLKILDSDTENAIEFNSTFSGEIFMSVFSGLPFSDK